MGAAEEDQYEVLCYLLANPNYCCSEIFLFLFKNPPVLTPPDCEMHSFANVYNLLPIVFLGFLNYLFAHFFGEILDNVGSMGLYLQGLDNFIF